MSNDTRTKKEIVYDDQIAPLISEVVNLCHQHGISMVSRFDISDEENPLLMVSTQLPDGNGEWSKILARMPGLVVGDPRGTEPARPNPGFIGDSAEKFLSDMSKKP